MKIVLRMKCRAFACLTLAVLAFDCGAAGAPGAADAAAAAGAADAAGAAGAADAADAAAAARARDAARPADATPLESLPYSPALDTASMDRSVNACDDLYHFACGGWQKRNPIPADQASWSVYGKLYVDNQRYLWGILRDASRAGQKRDPSQAKIGDYFAACMDTDAIERAGITPIRSDLEAIDALPHKRAIANLIGRLHARTQTGGILFGSGVEQDAKDATREIAAVYAGGIGMPDRDYYTRTDAKSAEARQKYVEHVARELALAGERPESAAQHARTIMKIETALASASLTRVEERDPYQVYHRESLSDLRKHAPDFDWDAYFRSVGTRTDPWLNDSQPRFIAAMNQVLVTTSLADLKTYLRWSVISAAAPYLSSGFVRESFAFRSAYLRGVQQDRERWKKCVAWVDRDLGEALGREFVRRAFPESNKVKTLRMTQQIERAMRARIEGLDWMSAQTKREALKKLSQVRNKIGYPDVWRDYSALTVARNDFFGNFTRAAEFETRRQQAKIGRPVDRDEWGMTPPTVNAQYNPALNDVNFPAGVLLPPLFDPKLDAAPSYGDTGGTIGHELTHAFDDEGRQYDGLGNLRDWWTQADAAQFEQRAQCIRDQYAGYTVVDDVHINGKLTSGEDIADLGGLLLAWMAWKEETRNLQLESIDGLRPDQRFFVGFAQWACSNERPEDLRLSARIDPHSPAKYRINGVVSNMPEFARAFSCKAGNALYKDPAHTCKVW